ncbi:RbsD/FucU domain-containing protein [Brachyspira sp. SAP_772]|nr:RbsD/FucU domain-containing protein [Brachyspira sp. SAP_772]
MKPNDNSKPNIWEDYYNIIIKYEPSFKEFEYIDRFSFYEKAKNAYACIATGETSIYACLIITKGVIIK